MRSQSLGRFFVSRPWAEPTLLGVLLLLSVVIQRVLTPGCCEGPDLVAYQEIAILQQTNPNFWADPDSFGGNFWAMLYPTFLQTTLSISGNSLMAVQWVQMLLAASLLLGAWLLTFHLGRGIRLATAGVVAISPATVGLGANLGYEVLLAWLLTLSMVLAWARVLRGSDSTIWAKVLLPVLSGLTIGLAVLAQSKVIIVAPVIIYLFWRQQRSRAGWALGGMLAALLPWMIRNLLVLGSPNPLTGNGPYNLWVGNNPDATTGGSMLTAPPLPPGVQSQSEAAVRWIIEQPEIAVNLLFRKSMRLWEPQFIYPDLLPIGPIRSALHLYVALLAVLTLSSFVIFLGARIFVSPPKLPDVAPLAVFVGLFYLSHLPFIAEPRFMSAVSTITSAVSLPTIIYIIRRLCLRRSCEEDLSFR